jgi:hypothetical protein
MPPLSPKNLLDHVFEENEENAEVEGTQAGIFGHNGFIDVDISLCQTYLITCLIVSGFGTREVRALTRWNSYKKYFLLLFFNV